MTLKSYANYKKTPDFWFEKRHEKFGNFHLSICQNWDVDGIPLSKIGKV